MYKTVLASSNIEINLARSFVSRIFNTNVPEYLKFCYKDVVLLKDDNEIIGAAFLKDSYFYYFGEKIKGTFITYLCISYEYRNKGLSYLVMNKAHDECIKRDSKFSIVIARKAVDHFYKKFNYWGVSNYSRITIKSLPDIKNDEKFVIEQVDTSNIKDLSTIYIDNYKSSLGAVFRSDSDWDLIFKKIKHFGYRFICFKKYNTTVGYAVLNLKSEIIEIASLSDYLDFLNLLSKKIQSELQIYASNSHPIFLSLEDCDFVISSRSCSFGGHMIKIIDDDFFSAETDKSIPEYLTYSDIKRLFKKTIEQKSVFENPLNFQILDEI